MSQVRLAVESKGNDYSTCIIGKVKTKWLSEFHGWKVFFMIRLDKYRI